MRWDLFLFGAAAVLMALAVKYSDEPWLWDGTVYLGVALMTWSLPSPPPTPTKSPATP